MKKTKMALIEQSDFQKANDVEENFTNLMEFGFKGEIICSHFVCLILTCPCPYRSLQPGLGGRPEPTCLSPQDGRQKNLAKV